MTNSIKSDRIMVTDGCNKLFWRVIWLTGLVSVFMSACAAGGMEESAGGAIASPPTPPGDATYSSSDEQISDDQIPSVIRGSKDGEGIPTLSSALNELYHLSLESPEEIGAMTETAGLQIQNGGVWVMITLREEVNVADISERIAEDGGEVTGSYQNLVDAWIPIEKLGQMAELTDVAFIQEQISTLPSSDEK